MYDFDPEVDCFSDLLDRYLDLREAVQVPHGPIHDEFMDAKNALNHVIKQAFGI